MKHIAWVERLDVSPAVINQVMETVRFGEPQRSTESFETLAQACGHLLTNLTVEVINFTDPTGRRSPHFPVPGKDFTLFTQVTGETIVRVGGWKQRQSPVRVSAGEAIAIRGLGKRSYENGSRFLSTGVVLAAKMCFTENLQKHI